jgi:hypothetical protein
MFRISNKLGMGVVATAFLAAPVSVSAAPITFVCEGEFRTQIADVDSVSEDMFGGTMHVALVREDEEFVEVRLQAFEGETRTPVQTYALMPESLTAEQIDEVMGSAVIPGLNTSRSFAGVETGEDQGPADALEISATDEAVMLHQTIESGPMMRARVDGKPLVPTRERVATVKMRLDRVDGSLNLVWSENLVKDHKIPGAIRVSKVRLRDEKSYDARCMPVRQRAF